MRLHRSILETCLPRKVRETLIVLTFLFSKNREKPSGVLLFHFSFKDCFPKMEGKRKTDFWPFEKLNNLTFVGLLQRNWKRDGE